MNSSQIHIGVDASNIRQGGGITHLSRLLSYADPETIGVERVTVWAPKKTLSALPDPTWLAKRESDWLESSLPKRGYWQQRILPKALSAEKCSVLFSPGGTIPYSSPVKTVSMSQNMLPFEPAEAALFGVFSFMYFKLRLLRSSQGRSFARADGVIFLSRYARDRLINTLTLDPQRTVLIPHGVEPRFFRTPRRARELAECTSLTPFRLLYVSILMPYKHQIEIARAATILRKEGLALTVDFVGASWGGYGTAFESELRRLDPDGVFLRWLGEIPFEGLHLLYREADGFVFASSCENLPNIMIEAMAAGLPILSSGRGPMPEVLGDAGCYFDPYVVDSIVAEMRRFVGDRELRERLALGASARAHRYSWKNCADETFAFVASVAQGRDSL